MTRGLSSLLKLVPGAAPSDAPVVAKYCFASLGECAIAVQSMRTRPRAPAFSGPRCGAGDPDRAGAALRTIRPTPVVAYPDRHGLHRACAKS